MKGLWMSLLMATMMASAAPIYKVVKEDGTVVYTDNPEQAAESMQLKPVNTANPLMTEKQQQALQEALQQQQDKAVNYQLSIVSPANEETIWNNQGKFNVRGQMNPQGTGGEFQLFVNGNKLQSGTSALFALSDLERGEYQLQLKYVNNSGKILALSQVTRVYLHRMSVLFNKN